MIRGTTPLHTFKFPVDILDNYENMIITYRQNNKIKLEKVLSEKIQAAFVSECEVCE